jgi:hypothetical protein
VTFKMEVCDFTGTLPYFQGRLIRYAYVWYKYIVSVRMAEGAKWAVTGHFVEGAWIPAFGAYLTSCTRVFRGSSAEVKQWKCYCDLPLHLLLKLKMCESLLLPFSQVFMACCLCTRLALLQKPHLSFGWNYTVLSNVMSWTWHNLRTKLHCLQICDIMIWLIIWSVFTK